MDKRIPKEGKNPTTIDKRGKTMRDMEDNLLRLLALEDHAKMFCNKTTQLFIEICRLNMEQAIKAERKE